ncbi:hypothetical protein SAMN04487930_10488 [Cytophaga hutchinsonii ATCC 33406]|nr:hypothetical protein SAMN04487930_10488 [Cytophaga hutchinsonii ATCC 33406]
MGNLYQFVKSQKTNFKFQTESDNEQFGSPRRIVFWDLEFKQEKEYSYLANILFPVFYVIFKNKITQTIKAAIKSLAIIGLGKLTHELL